MSRDSKQEESRVELGSIVLAGSDACIARACRRWPGVVGSLVARVLVARGPPRWYSLLPLRAVLGVLSANGRQWNGRRAAGRRVRRRAEPPAATTSWNLAQKRIR